MKKLRDSIDIIKHIVISEYGDHIKVFKLIKSLSSMLNSNSFVIDDGGVILDKFFINKKAELMFSRMTILKNGNLYISPGLDNILSSTITTSQIEGEELFGRNSFSLITPIYICSNRKGTLVCYRQYIEYIISDFILVDLSSIAFSFILTKLQDLRIQNIEKEYQVIRNVISKLTYSEIEVVLYIFKNFTGYEDTIIAKNIASAVNVSHSVIINAVRKFESAGIISSQSRGKKGTYIKIINRHLLKELKKLL